jgi:DNA polymerase III subunit delta'
MFDKIIGNNQVKTVFKRLLSSQKIPRSLLFVGEEGVGKRYFALEIAKAIICQHPNNGEACDHCAACKRADKFVFPKPDDKKEEFEKVFFSEHSDIGIVIPYKNSILVDAVRHLEKEANFRPYEAKARFFIIDNAEKLNTAKDNAANALLKTLEEPSATSHIFLITSRPAALLPTIRSRCQIIRFAPLETDEIKDYLLKTQKFAPDDAELSAKLAHGSLGRALSTDIGKFREQREIMLKVLESLSGNKNIAALLKTAEEINDAKNKDNYVMFLEILQNLIHDIWILRLGESSEKIINADLKPQLNRLAENFESPKLAKWMTEIELLRENLAVNLNKKIATDALFMQMANG